MSFFKNKYLTLSIAFIIWMFFFDTHSVINNIELTKELNRAKAFKEEYQKKLEKTEKKFKSMQSEDNLINYAREHYFIKKKNEDIFIIDEAKGTKAFFDTYLKGWKTQKYKTTP